MGSEAWKRNRRRNIFLKVFAAACIAALFGNGANLSAQLNDANASADEANLQHSGKPVSQHETISVNGVTRTYQLYIPRTYVAGWSALIVALHGRGGGGPGAAFEQQTHLDDLADREGFAIAYPDGLVDATGTLDWNYFYDPFFVNGPDDVSFVREVIDSLQKTIHPNRRKIYVTGTSAGGFMAQTIGVALSDRVAAIAAVEGGISVTSPTSPQTVPHAAAPISVLMLKGDQDAANFYCGADYPSFGIHEASADDDFAYWTGTGGNKCRHISSKTPFCFSRGVGDANANVTPGTASKLTEKEAIDCKENVEVKVYRLIGGIDTWNLAPMNVPGKVPYSPDLNFYTGVTTNEILWRFFERHPKPE